MPYADFVHLRVHSAYSLSEGAIKIPQLIALCREHAMPAVAVTDTGNLFGALEFAMAAAREGVQPLIGCQLYVARPGSETGVGAATPEGVRKRLDQLVLLVQDEAGYRNLLMLVSKAYLETEPGARPHVAVEDVEAYSAGLIALTGGPEGAVGAMLADGQMEAAEAMLGRLEEAFPGRLYVELMRHGLSVEERIEGDLIDLAYARDLPLVATNDCYFVDEKMYEAHDALLCIAEGAHIADEKRRRLTPQHGFRSPAEMRKLFADLPEAVDNTLTIARRCAFMPERRPEILPAFPTEGERTEADQLRAEAEEGLRKRLEILEVSGDEVRPYWDRLEFELRVIIEMGFPGYFLIVADFIQWA
ncbi:MAG: PHP domain-containing protein, partial [Alphaproteobacteria bacterium]|nr:PHP domain-containing protein [Alphaproteobacteria bacterium]